RFGEAGAGRRGQRARGAVDLPSGGGAGQLHTDAGAPDRRAVPDAGGGRVLDLGPGDGGDGPGGAGGDQGRGGDGDRVSSSDGEDGVHGGGDVPPALGPGAGGRQRGGAAAGREGRGGGAGAGAGESGVDQTAHEVHGGSVR